MGRFDYMNILVFTGSRGEWGYLKPILDRFKKQDIKFEICVTNMHLLKSKGYSINEIQNCGFEVKYRIPIYGTEDHLVATSKAISEIISSLSSILYSNKFDLLLIAGDRFETLAAAITAFYNEIPIAHIQAGEKSGNKDDMARHSITRLSSLHFASNDDAFNRLLNSGEEKWRICLSGAPQLDDIQQFRIENKLRFKNKALLILHPETLGVDKYVNISDIIEFLLKKNYLIDVILPNTDSGSINILKEIEKFNHLRIKKHRNLNRDIFLNSLANCTFLIGNSSSGILEAPTLKTPVINIGNRQSGRIQAANVINCLNTQKENLENSLSKLQTNKFKTNLQNCVNPYGDGRASERIIKKIMDTINNPQILIKKLTI